MNPTRTTRSVLLLAAAALLITSAAGFLRDGPSTPEDAEAAPGVVSIVDFTFEPNMLSTSVGSTVTWTNEDEAQHTVTSDADGPLASGDLAGGATYEATFDTSETYEYFCELHPTMRGTVEVVS